MFAGRYADAARRRITEALEGSEFGINAFKNRSPASVGVTLRVVRLSSRSPNFSSSLRTEWLRADCEIPTFVAARVKLCSSATVRNNASFPKSSRCIWRTSSTF
jgi:hypothetical protein